MALESALVSKLNKFAVKNNLIYLNIKDKNLNGWPDSLLIDRNGVHYWFELKKEDGTGRVSDIQKYRISEMKGYNCEVYVVKSIQEIKEIIYGDGL